MDKVKVQVVSKDAVGLNTAYGITEGEYQQYLDECIGKIVQR